MKEQLLRLLSFAFSLAFSTASSTISMPITFLALGARIWAIVPVPEYKSNITLSFVSPIKSLAIVYSLSAPKEFVWKNENDEMLNLSPNSSSVILSSP